MVASKKNSIVKKENSACTGRIGFFISYAIGITISLVIISSLSHIEKLSNCDCSKLPYSKYIKEWFIFMIFFYVANFTLFFISGEECHETYLNLYPMVYTIYIIIGLISIVMLIRLFLYMRELKKNCKCAYGKKESFIYWYLFIIIAIWVSLIAITLLLFLFAFLLTNFR